MSANTYGDLFKYIYKSLNLCFEIRH